jgi:hypothetical protein
MPILCGPNHHNASWAPKDRFKKESSSRKASVKDGKMEETQQQTGELDMNKEMLQKVDERM